MTAHSPGGFSNEGFGTRETGVHRLILERPEPHLVQYVNAMAMESQVQVLGNNLYTMRL